MRYGGLLVILVVTYLLSAVTGGALVSAVQVLLFLAVVLIALRSGRFPRRIGQVIAVGLLLGSAAAGILQLVDYSGVGGALASLWTAMILLLAVFFIVRQVMGQPEITVESIYGVLSAYMMIGLIFSAVYVAMWKFGAQPFFANGTKPNTKIFQYFSFTTLTTLGYGDFTAAGDDGRAVAVLEAIVGQMFLATLVARLVAGFRWSDRAAARRRGQQGGPAADRGAQVSATELGSGPPGPGPGQPGTTTSMSTGTATPDPGPAATARPSPGRSRAKKKASAPGLIRLSPPGTVRGRGTGPRTGERKEAGGSGPAPARPSERT
jgi:hypothetical protein